MGRPRDTEGVAAGTMVDDGRTGSPQGGRVYLHPGIEGEVLQLQVCRVSDENGTRGAAAESFSNFACGKVMLPCNVPLLLPVMLMALPSPDFSKPEGG